jgi:hypothetical protein
MADYYRDVVRYLRDAGYEFNGKAAFHHRPDLAGKKPEPGLT